MVVLWWLCLAEKAVLQLLNVKFFNIGLAFSFLLDLNV